MYGIFTYVYHKTRPNVVKFLHSAGFLEREDLLSNQNFPQWKKRLDPPLRPSLCRGFDDFDIKIRWELARQNLSSFGGMGRATGKTPHEFFVKKFVLNKNFVWFQRFFDIITLDLIVFDMGSPRPSKISGWNHGCSRRGNCRQPIAMPSEGSRQKEKNPSAAVDDDDDDDCCCLCHYYYSYEDELMSLFLFSIDSWIE